MGTMVAILLGRRDRWEVVAWKVADYKADVIADKLVVVP
jgi:hypothetical protein